MDYNKRIKGLVKNIAGICLDINATGNDAFFYFQGHVGWLEIKLYRGGWSIRNDPFYQKDYLATSAESEEEAKQAIHKLKRTAEELTEILESFLEKN